MSAITRSARDDVFLSVFPLPNFRTPTPQTTPDIGSLSSPVRPFGGPINPDINLADEEILISSAWNVVQTYVASNEPEKAKQNDKEVAQQLVFLLEKPLERRQLLRWLRNEITTYYRKYVIPSLTIWEHPISVSAANSVLAQTLSILSKAQEYPYVSFDLLRTQSFTNVQIAVFKGFCVDIRTAWHALIRNTLPQPTIMKTLAFAIFDHMQKSLMNKTNPEDRPLGRCFCLPDLQTFPLEKFASVGLGDDIGERALAFAVHRFFQGPAVEHGCFKVDWATRQSVVPKMRLWLLATCIPSILDARQRMITTPEDFGANMDSEIEQHASSAIKYLLKQRVKMLFDAVKLWPASKGAVLDVRECLAYGNARDKAELCSSFVKQIQSQLLHVGNATTDILTMYINVIHVFKLLDARGVLLEKVALPIRHYLRQRDDTVNVIAASCLANVDSKGRVAVDSKIVCANLARELEQAELAAVRRQTTLNWNDMQWQPDPIDASPNFRSAMSDDDVMSNVFGLFDTEDFIKEVTKVLAQHLLQSKDLEFVKETRLVEMLKMRFDSAKLQEAEVMLKDLRDSVAVNRRLNPTRGAVIPTPREIQDAIPEDGISIDSLYETFADRINRPKFLASLKLVATKRRDLYFSRRVRPPANRSETSDTLDVNVKIVSAFFWPEMRSEDFSLPPKLEQADHRIRSEFEATGGQRKLCMRPALARVSMELEFEDRKISEENVAGWRASVIDAFAEKAEGLEDGVSPTSLTELLGMDEDLIQDALTFWTTKRVLYQPSPGRYAILERLDMDAASAEQPVARPADAVSGIKSQDAVFKENAAMFETFISNMLKNGGPKQIDGMMGITNMLKMVLPTFTYGDAEVQALLEEMEARGEVLSNGETWIAAP